MQGSLEPSKLLSCVLILAEDIEAVGGYLKQVFSCQNSHTSFLHPCKHAVLNISKESTILMIQSSDCDEALLASFAAASVRHIFVTVIDARLAQMRAVQYGGQVIESNIDQNGGNMCIVEGPEGIIIHILAKTDRPVHEIIMGSMRPKNEKEEDDESEGYSDPTPGTLSNPRPIIHTLDVGLLSNTHPNGFAPCPPNYRKPIPFETEV